MLALARLILLLTAELTAGLRKSAAAAFATGAQYCKLFSRPAAFWSRSIMNVLVSTITGCQTNAGAGRLITNMQPSHLSAVEGIPVPAIRVEGFGGYGG